MYKYCLYSHYNYVRSGYLHVYYGAIRDTGVGGYEWSQQSHSRISYAYSLTFNHSAINPSNSGDARYIAFPVHAIITFIPSYYVRSGYADVSNGRLKNLGVIGYGWSGLGRSDARVAYNLGFNSSTVYPSNNDDHYFAFSVIRLGTVVLRDFYCTLH